MSETFYITTPIYYPNGQPHLGHVYTTICADAVARYHRLHGDDTMFLTGTDEHGVKMVKTAAERGIEPRALADEMAGEFLSLWKELHITNDDFIRTPEPRHRQAVQEIVRQMQANGDIYLGVYEGWYDEGQEEFVAETEAKNREFKSAISGRPLVRYKEPTYFFRLSKYAPMVLEYILAHPDFIMPESRRNEVISKLKAGVEDLSISRASLKWGIPMPHDPDHVIYVWIDALSNYISALGYGQSDPSKYNKYWPVNVHLIGKEIMWFHTVYWPAMLMAVNQPLPKQVFAHGWWTSNGAKMSKSMGNFIDLDRLRAIIGTYSLDALRFYLMAAAPFGNDLNWTDADFNRSFNELKNVVGNCLNRTIKMIGMYRDGKLPAVEGELEQIDRDLLARGEALGDSLNKAYGEMALQHAALLPVELARATNGFIDATQPFKLKKDPAMAGRLSTVLHVAAVSIYRALVGLLPILPEKAAEGLKQLGVAVGDRKMADLLNTLPAAGTQFTEPQPLFPNVETPKA